MSKMIQISTIQIHSCKPIDSFISDNNYVVVLPRSGGNGWSNGGGNGWSNGGGNGWSNGGGNGGGWGNGWD